MKIQVVRVDGNIETINLVGTVKAEEPGNDFEFPRNQSAISVPATGADYFFREDGLYDGWGMGCSLPEDAAKALAEAVERDREIQRKDGAK